MEDITETGSNETLILVKFCANYGRMGTLHGLFVCTPEERESILGKDVYFGECLGKHSEVEIRIEEKHLPVVSDDHEHVNWLRGLCGTTVSGFNPIEYWRTGEDEVES